ncbi:LysR family transcriptional regulator [Nocardia transvalensis]|uniref:LysR family transcriptional regulator n=1 Tax=Nocardia transvalensis TaxID=37333 RepID=UPI0018953852|nr:LysR family transcriptional regulator [Nocardia transvalensis]MBF6333740.1 LysR family transcriptional regulator [Nocardia transvalensis]
MRISGGTRPVGRSDVVTPVDFRQIEAFVVLAEELHFGRAAERLRITPGRVSQLIRLLERQVGEPLFARTSRKVEVLAAGESLLTELDEPYRQLLQAVENARARARGVSGTFKMAYVVTISMGRAHACAAAFEREHPGVAVTTVPLNGLSSRLGNPLYDGLADVMLTWFPCDPGRFADREPELIFGPTLSTSPRALAVNVDHPLAHRDSVDAEELAEYEILMPPPTFPDWFVDAWTPPTTPSGRPIRRRTVVADWSVDPVMDTIVRTNAIHIASTAVAEALFRRAIVMVPLVGLGDAYLIPVRRRDTDSALVRSFIDVAARTCHELDACGVRTVATER